SQNGYVGCIEARCNYYQKNKKVLSKDWFYIKRINPTTFIVRGNARVWRANGQKNAR
ncbi:MAG: hypothetical protein ACI9LN_004742, partial [Saprospiraceae bacterium]